MLESIISNQMAPGDVLPSERELSEQFGVSRTVIREAVRTLNARGLLDVRMGSGVRVATVDPKVVDDALQLFLWSSPIGYDKVHEVREVLEVQAARLAATRATPADLENMRESLRLMEETMADVERAARHDLEFHRHIARSTGNELILILHDSIGSALIDVRVKTLRKSPEIARATVVAHTKILDAIAAHDPDAAAAAMQSHLSQVEGFQEASAE
jgi:GntR family transcriptional repressor for pyruvate dehydrogenase complex